MNENFKVVRSDAKCRLFKDGTVEIRMKQVIHDVVRNIRFVVTWYLQSDGSWGRLEDGVEKKFQHVEREDVESGAYSFE